jgi:hypothetical protein
MPIERSPRAAGLRMPDTSRICSATVRVGTTTTASDIFSPREGGDGDGLGVVVGSGVGVGDASGVGVGVQHVQATNDYPAKRNTSGRIKVPSGSGSNGNTPVTASRFSGP